MIRFFRNIRQKLAAENKVAKYLRYAIGEILLVVVGILIALQINNWNEERKSKNEEKVIINNLREELLQVQNDLRVKFDLLEDSRNAVQDLMNLFGKSRSQIQKANTDSLIFFTLSWPEFNPTSSVLDDLLQSGRLRLITNSELRKLLFKWTPTIEEAKSQYKEMIRFNNDRVFDFLNKHVSFKNIDEYGMVYSEKKSVFEIDNSLLFNQVYYENMLEGQLFFFTASLNEIKEINVLIDKILNKS